MEEGSRRNTVPGEFAEWFDGGSLTNRGMYLSPWTGAKYLWAVAETVGGMDGYRTSGRPHLSPLIRLAGSGPPAVRVRWGAGTCTYVIDASRRHDLRRHEGSSAEEPYRCVYAGLDVSDEVTTSPSKSAPSRLRTKRAPCASSSATSTIGARRHGRVPRARPSPRVAAGELRRSPSRANACDRAAAARPTPRPPRSRPPPSRPPCAEPFCWGRRRDAADCRRSATAWGSGHVEAARRPQSSLPARRPLPAAPEPKPNGSRLEELAGRRGGDRSRLSRPARHAGSSRRRRDADADAEPHASREPAPRSGPVHLRRRSRLRSRRSQARHQPSRRRSDSGGTSGPVL